MTAKTITQLLNIGLLAVSSGGCAILGPTCLARQERGAVTAFDGEVGPGQVVGHQVPYDTQGSQNTGDLTWDGFRSPNPPQIKFYATRVECTDFQPPPAVNTAECATLARAGTTDMGPATNLIVTHGRGNPETLGSPAEYKIWVVGDADRSVRYTVSITWFYGPDC